MALPDDDIHGFTREALKYISDITSVSGNNTPNNFADAGTTTFSSGYAFCDIDLDGGVDLADALEVNKHYLKLNEFTPGTDQWDHYIEVLSYYDPYSTPGTLHWTSNNGPVMALDRIRDEYNPSGTGAISLGDYIRGGSYVTDQTVNNNIPTTTSSMGFDDYYSTRKAVAITFELISGGGGGAGSDVTNAASPRTAGDGGNGGYTTIVNSTISTVTEDPGLGGAAGTSNVSSAGEASDYGAGGSGGINSDVGSDTAGSAPASTSYGAGGGSGGTSNETTEGGDGGQAATKRTGTLYVNPGEVLTITIGAGGAGGAAGTNGNAGGAGASGYVKLTVNNTVTEFTSSGTYTVTAS